MPNHQKHRGANPKDAKLFATEQLPKLRTALADLAYLLDRDYALKSSLKLVGDRFNLTTRQRLALSHAVVKAQSLALRKYTKASIADLYKQEVYIDGYNQLITTESLLAGGAVFRGMDTCLRDIASVHSTYRKVAETKTALLLIGQFLHTKAQVAKVTWVLDSPISNSGRLKVFLTELAEQEGWNWEILLDHNPDAYLVANKHKAIAISSDGWILDRVDHWFNLSEELVNPKAWVLDMCLEN